MSAHRAQRLDRQRDLQHEGWIWPINSLNVIRPHTGKTTIRHWIVKCLVCQRIKNKGSAFLCEPDHPDRGKPDVLDLNESEPGAYIYEIESSTDPEKHRSKAMQYDGPCITDTFVLPVSEAPLGIDELAEWVEEIVV